MTNKSDSPSMAFQSVNLNPIDESWNGSPITLKPNDTAVMQPTPGGSLVLDYMSTATENNPGTLAVTSGGGTPTILPAPAFAKVPGILVMNSTGQSLSVINVSPPAMAVPILVEAFAPGMPGRACLSLPGDGTTITLEAAQCAQAMLPPGWMQIILQAYSNDAPIFAIIGGPLDATGNNAYVISLNDTTYGNTGYASSPFAPPPQGYFATTKSNLFTYQINWGNSMMYIANMSSASAATGTVQLRSL